MTSRLSFDSRPLLTTLHPILDTRVLYRASEASATREMDCLPLPVVCIQCGPGVNNACHFKFIGERQTCMPKGSSFTCDSNLSTFVYRRTHDRICHGCFSGNHLLAPRPLLLLLCNRRGQEVSRATGLWNPVPSGRPPYQSFTCFRWLTS